MADHPSFYDQVKGVVGGVKAASADGKFTLEESLRIGVDVIGAALHVNAFIKNPNEHAEELIRDCERLFDELVPADIVAIPDYMEPTIKGIGRGLIRPGIIAAVDKLKAA